MMIQSRPMSQDDRDRRRQRFARDFDRAVARRRAMTLRPYQGASYAGVISFKTPFRHQAAAAAVRLRVDYVPDRDVLDLACLPAYLAMLAGEDRPEIEEVLETVAADFSSEVVARFARVSARLEGEAGFAYVRREVWQPRWKSGDLLGRLPAD